MGDYRSSCTRVNLWWRFILVEAPKLQADLTTARAPGPASGAKSELVNLQHVTLILHLRVGPVRHHVEYIQSDSDCAKGRRASSQANANPSCDAQGSYGFLRRV